jgi:hypothetical protein
VAEWDRSKALAAFESFGLHGTNAALAIYWLSLWDGNRPPQRSAFNPMQVRELLPAIAITQMSANDEAVCRLSGSHIDQAIGRPLLGVKVIDLVDGRQRPVRRARLKAIVDGGVSLSRVRYDSASGDDAYAEVIQLPFHGVMEDGSRQFLSHMDWRPSMSRPNSPGRAEYAGMPDEFYAIALA